MSKAGVDNIQIEDLKNLFLDNTPLVDVRAPVEFIQGSLPHAVNLPILNDEERALIGTTYKKQGQDAAVQLGYKIISGAVKEARLGAWSEYIKHNPKTVLYCFRGGKRSQITQQWLKEAGIDRPLIKGGYKAVRQFFIDYINEFSAQNNLLVISGPTGSGKTQLLNEISAFYPALDLEGIAHHRGSAFGAWSIPQPSQIDFENRLAVGLIKLESQIGPQRWLAVEDESRLIGKSCLPDAFFDRLRESEVLWLDEPIAVRVENIFKDYILNTAIGDAHQQRLNGDDLSESSKIEALKLFENYKKALLAISRKLGGLRTQEIMLDLETSVENFVTHYETKSNLVWIEKLLTYYYDPLYLKSLERRAVKVRFRGSKAGIIDYLKNIK